MNAVIASGEGKPIRPDQFIGQVSRADVLVLGEELGDPAFFALQGECAAEVAMAAEGRVDAGFEMFERENQASLDELLAGRVSESVFLADVRWPAAVPCAGYIRLMRLIHGRGGGVFALNAPRRVVAAAAQRGLDRLDSGMRRHIPPGFQVGTEKHCRHFVELAGEQGHAWPSRAVFAAQSLWEETMAWTALEQARPGRLFMVVAGWFHAAYSEGICASLRRRGGESLNVVTAIMMKPERLKMVHPEFGPIADYVIWGNDC